MRYLHPSINSVDLVHQPDLRRQSGMDAEDSAINNGRDSQAVKYVSAILPWIRVSILPHDLIIEPIDLRGS